MVTIVITIVDEDDGFNDKEGEKNSLPGARIVFPSESDSIAVSFWPSHDQKGNQKEEGAHFWKSKII